MEMNDLTKKTWDFLDAWEKAEKMVTARRDQLREAETARDAAAQELGKWLSPEDAKSGEVFHVWVGDGILAIHWGELMVGKGFKVNWRKQRTTGKRG